MPASADSAARRLDALAVEQTLRRLARQAEPPWLHGKPLGHAPRGLP